MNKEYEKLLSDPRWLKKRKRILKRDGYKCTACGSGEQLRVHHTYYIEQSTAPWDYPDDSLLTLCNDCHEKYHKEHELTFQLHHNKTGKKRKPKKVKIEKHLSLKALYKIWEPRLKNKKYKLLKNDQQG